jgi:hypothetical protein
VVSAIIGQAIVRACGFARNAQLSATCEELRGNRSALVFSNLNRGIKGNLQRGVVKEMKTKSKISGYMIRSVAYAVFLSVAFIAASSAFQSPNKWYKSAVATVGYGSTAKSPSPPRALSFAERVAYQRAIEDVYWRHRIWPKENSDRKPSLDAVMSQAQLENKVAGYLRDSLVLEDYWQRPITAEQLQAEMDRMARDTKQSEVLRELFEALGNDPAVIAECLARPILAQRLIADLSPQDQTRHVEPSQSDTLRAMSAATTLGQVVYTLPEIADAGSPPCTDDTWTATSTANAPDGRSSHTAVWTGTEMIVWGGWKPHRALNTGGRYNPSTDSWVADGALLVVVAVQLSVVGLYLPPVFRLLAVAVPATPDDHFAAGPDGGMMPMGDGRVCRTGSRPAISAWIISAAGI